MQGQFVDLQVRLTSQHGPKSWDIVVESPSGLTSTEPALLRTATSRFQTGQRLRVLNVRLAESEASFDEPAIVVASMGESSEAYLMGDERR
jgi:hypothetical protein